jgi:PAS domain S-box-containing protein
MTLSSSSGDGTSAALHVLWEDGERVFCKTWQTTDEGERRPFFAVLSGNPYPHSASIDRLVHEYELRNYLDSAWALQPVRLQHDQGRTQLLLEFAPGEPLDRFIGRPIETERFLRLAIALASAIGRLHERGLIHKDIKPANILVDNETNETRLTGFGIASRLPREHAAPEPPEFIAGTLPYMAPEQTGRMNRSIDSRGDLYSLGVTLYEVLTGQLPFAATSPMEWVHCHVARMPMAPKDRSPDIPAPISAIVMKLLAKPPEDRYQTAAGVVNDLRLCLTDWTNHASIKEFALGEFDRPDRLVSSERLYGRAREIDALLGSFERVSASGTPELILVFGYSGIGKSSVVNELHKTLVQSRGLFASGKFDQYKRDIPYATLAQAFHSLIRAILATPDAELSRWREDLRQALGTDGFLITQLVAELKLVIGEQQPLSELSPQEEKARFHAAFRRFIGVFARAEHPLALFLDDLQWVDAATLDLIEHLLSHPDVRHLMLIGAYRDNEVGPSHPLMCRIEAMRRAGSPVHGLSLEPLTVGDLRGLIADSLRCTANEAAPLAELIHSKTGGNPFFAIQFVSALVEEGMLSFRQDEARWSWDLERISAKGFTDNVVDLMVERLNRLPPRTQEAIQVMACLGDSADATQLAIALEMSDDDIHAVLWDGVRQELVHRVLDRYRFVHDRVQEAAYSLIPGPRRTEEHLRVGRLLAAKIPAERYEAAIFEIVNQLNRGVDSMSAPVERERLVGLNLVAGQRAKASAAYAAALTYFTVGATLLSEDAWSYLPELVFALELNRAECEFLTGALANAEERLAALASRAANTVERARIACLQIDLYLTLVQGDRAIDVGLDYLKHLGIDWTLPSTEQEARLEYDRVRSQVEKYTIEELIDLPLMTDDHSLATLDVLTKLCTPAFNADLNLLSLAICRVLSLSLSDGISDATAVAYVRLGMIAGLRFGEFDVAYRLGQLGCELVERRGLNRFRSAVYLNFGNMVMPWNRHVRSGQDLVRRAFDEATRAGDFVYAGVCRLQLNTNLIFAGDSLADIQREAEDALAFVQKMQFGTGTDFVGTQLAFVRMLRGLTTQFGSFDDGQFSEAEIERRFTLHSALSLVECWYWIRKSQARFFAGDCEAAVDASSRANRLLGISLTVLEAAEHYFYGALAHAASCDAIAADRHAPHMAALASHHRQLEIWAEKCPENFADRAMLAGAEIARLTGREVDAEHLYERAIRSAHANGFVHNEALANELAARFYRARGFEKIANTYLRDARDLYAQWGANGKVRQLEASHPHLGTEPGTTSPAGTIGTPVEHLDLATVISVSQAVSGEIVAQNLIDTLMRIAIEQAGAERGLLILLRENGPLIAAEATTDDNAIVVHFLEAPVTPTALPATVFSYALRTSEALVIDNAIRDSYVATDPYIRQRQARSILFLPLLNRSKLIGILYLENNLASHVFAPNRIAVLKLLASQAAISLENTRLYAELAEREARIRRLVEANIVGIIIWERAGLVVDANDAFLSMLGYDREDLAQRRIHRDWINTPDSSERSAQAWQELVQTGIVRPYEKDFQRKDGSRVPVLFGAAAIAPQGENGIGFFVDLSERKRAEESARESERRLHEMQIELAHVNRVVTAAQLSASIAHEINQPLAGIVMNASTSLRILSSEPPNVEGARETARRTIRDANRASDVIIRLRTLFSKKQMPTEQVDLNDVVEEVITLSLGELRRNNVQLHVSLAEDLPPVTGDRVQLQQVVLNLLSNASDAMSMVDERSRLLTIKTSWSDSGALLTVQDSGPGIDAARIDRVFDAFYSTKPGGLGIGLSICRTIIEAHGGRLSAATDVDGGAVLQFTLPIKPAA